MSDILRIKNSQGQWEEIKVIQGKPGNDGYTPQKGVDYFDGAPGKDGDNYVITEADYNEIADIVITKLPTAEGRRY